MALYTILIISLCGGLGTLARYSLFILALQLMPSLFPWGTLFVNLLGSFAIGFVWQLSEFNLVASHLRTFIAVGFLGGFTTFSAFSFETCMLLKNSNFKLALLNITAQMCGGIALVFLGIMLAKLLFK